MDRDALGKLQQIVESMDFESSVEDGYDISTADNEHKNKQNRAIIEKQIKGLIAYYRTLKESTENNRDMAAIERLDELKKYVTIHLNQFSQWT
jgi:hypothetical protein|tara:strand:+ start:18303 stop:18581 length:279 start_codon:yes stop_codon:yes gene_type:complete